MFNSQLPSLSDLPTSRQLFKSTLIAAASAAAILVTVVLPSEYGIDPTGVGSVLGLTEMGEIKMQLAEEAAADRAIDPQAPAPAVQPARAATATVVADAEATTDTGERRDRMQVTLVPGEAAEVKLSAAQGTRINFQWSVAGGHVNFDAHGDPVVRRRGFYHGYGTGRASTGEAGELVAAFDGAHGWYWRNRSDATVTVTLQTSGAYTSIDRVL